MNRVAFTIFGLDIMWYGVLMASAMILCVLLALKEGKRVNAISAGPIKTLSAKGIKDFSSILTVVEEKSPLHRNVTTTQVGNVATFLLSDMSEAITGQVIYADSGYNIMGV